MAIILVGKKRTSGVGSRGKQSGNRGASGRFRRMEKERTRRGGEEGEGEGATKKGRRGGIVEKGRPMLALYASMLWSNGY